MCCEAARMAMQFQISIPFIESLGFELLRFDSGEAEIAFTPRPEHLNSWSVVHGGVIMSLLDVTLAHAARAPAPADPPDSRGVVTLEMKTSFMRPGLGRMTAQSRRMHRTHTLAFCEGSVRDEKGELIAHATGSFKFLNALPAGGRQLKRLNASD
jgi:uncharacterized protein (TIGR00369 family)